MLYASGMGAAPAGWASDPQDVDVLGDWAGQTVPGGFRLPPELTAPMPPPPAPVFVPADAAAAPAVRNVRLMAGSLDWDDLPPAFAKGDLQGAPVWIAAGLLAVSVLDEVAELARYLGVDAKAVAVALLAEADQDSSRTAGRVARSVLANADKALADKARRAVGL